MANEIQLKRSSVSGRIPDSANVLVGEPVVNLADQIIYTKDGSGTVKVIGAGTTSNISEGTNLYFTNARAIASLTEGTGINIDANGLISSTVTSGASIIVSESEPISPSNGNLWLKPSTGVLSIYASSFWQEFSRTLAGYFEPDYENGGYDLLKLRYTLEQINNVSDSVTPQNGDFLSYNGTEWVSTTTLSNILTLTSKTSAPTVPINTFAVANGTTWDPASKANGKPYPVFYDGTSWNALY